MADSTFPHRFCVICGAKFTPSMLMRVTCGDDCEEAFARQERHAAEQIMAAALPSALGVLGYSSIDEYVEANPAECDSQPESTKAAGVYFIESGTCGPIKIGYSADIEKRLNDLSVASPKELSVVGYIDGDVDTEHALHGRFAECRIRGEWFKPVQALRDFIRDNARPLQN